MGRKKQIVGDVAERVQALQREGLGVNATAAQLRAEGLPGSPASVSRLLGARRSTANTSAGKTRAKPADKPIARQPKSISGSPSEAEDDLEAAERAHARLGRRAEKLANKIDRELALPEPNWLLVRALSGTERSVVQDLIRTRIPREKKPEDDPANIEAARLLVSSIRARVEAARRAGGGPA